MMPVLVDLAGLLFFDETSDPAEIEIRNNDSALFGLVLGFVLLVFNMLITGLTDADPVAILIAFFAWAPLLLRICRLGGPSNDGVCYISVAADILGPLGVAVLSVVALAV